MKFILPLLLLSTPLVAKAADTLLPAGSLVQCTVSEPKLSSKTTQVGDPVLCQVSHVELYGRAVVPYGSYMVGHFEDYKDPGHFVGKGWVELKFDRLVVGDTVVPLQARVVAVPKYNVDKDGKIHGNGHPVKDTVEWLIPVLWPLDLINLPRRGPRVVLKPETRLTLKVMDDVGLPAQEPARQPALISRAPEPPRRQQYAPAPVERSYAPQNYAPQPSYAPSSSASSSTPPLPRPSSTSTPHRSPSRHHSAGSSAWSSSAICPSGRLPLPATTAIRLPRALLAPTNRPATQSERPDSHESGLFCLLSARI